MKTIYVTAVAALLVFATCTPSKTVVRSMTERTPNQLVGANSPYLLKHALDPVDWHQWSDATLKKAQKEDKLLLISVGYSACHWCTIMERESFMDTTIAKFINEHFIPIKVDREERPDLDDIYISACEISAGRNCGWPLNALALPDGSPFWAGTYFPKDQWLRILEYMVSEREKNPTKVEAWASDILNGIYDSEAIAVAEREPVFADTHLKQFTAKLLQSVDFENGGHDAQMLNVKFPMPNNYQFLLKNYALTENKKALDAVTITLDNMAYGGIYDHINGGFLRYSTDTEWKVPLFEKTLYDNGQLVSLYAEAYRAVKNPIYKERVYETLNFIELEMLSPKGAFYSSVGSESDKRGQFYAWTEEEVTKTVTDEEAVILVKDFYGITKTGNWQNGKNIPYMKQPASFVAQKFGLEVAKFEQKISAAKEEMRSVSVQTREKPAVDKKVLTAWNALMLKGYIDAYRTFGEERFLNIALKNANFLAKEMMQKDGRLIRNYKDGNKTVNGFLDDYALTAEAFVALYQVTFDEQWIFKAKKLTDYALAHFFDENTSTFFYTSDLDPPLVTRKKEMTDNVIPSSNSAMAKVLHDLGIYLFDVMYEETAKNMVNNMLTKMATTDAPNFYTNWGNVLTDFIYEPFEVAIVGANFSVLRQELDQQYIPNMLLLGGIQEGTLELLEGKLIKGETIIYVCKNKVCKFPVSVVTEALGLMKENYDEE